MKAIPLLLALVLTPIPLRAEERPELAGPDISALAAPLRLDECRVGPVAGDDFWRADTFFYSGEREDLEAPRARLSGLDANQRLAVALAILEPEEGFFADLPALEKLSSFWQGIGYWEMRDWCSIAVAGRLIGQV